MSTVPPQPPVRFVSTEAEPRERGREFGETWRGRVAATVAGYRDLFARGGVHDLAGPGADALAAVERWAPELAAEIRGIAEGAALPVTDVAAVNARTEILAGARGGGECSTVVALGGPGAEPVAVQNWDWYAGLADNWLEWEIPQAEGRRTTTLTEFGVVGKIGVNDRGVGCLFNILHHREDRPKGGVPVHVIARRLLDTAYTVTDALRTAGTAPVSASTTLTVVGGLAAGRTAIACELWPGGPGHVLPDADGLLLHTNHFLTRPGSDGDTEPVTDPDTLVRYDVLRRALHGKGATLTTEAAVDALCDHTGGLCAHAPDDRPDAFRTLATVRIDFATRALHITSGPPCLHRPEPHPGSGSGSGPGPETADPAPSPEPTRSAA
ncbi:C45 family peptidase [Streptomyces sp. LHD-70]|uniref:C45 family peptidase n=1 Tax=Streptomyces sp. LHD-70 TaxID=3072140 RepID=UPI00280D361D|nr:C45 family peptidase [Streptomyces sp. LHD-70]MDQ8702592.1 C45 family peptidase [Streptomyces sp. LHD-70]